MVALAALAAAAILAGIFEFFRVTGFILKFWWIVIPVGFAIWVYLLAYEFGPRRPEKKLPFSIKKRVRPSWIRWIGRGRRATDETPPLQ
jgi:hypothetical protein